MSRASIPPDPPRPSSRPSSSRASGANATSATPPSSGDGETSLVTAAGTAIGAGLLSAAFASMPAELRMGDFGSPTRAFSMALALTALLAPLGIAMVVIFRRARVGLRLVCGERATPLVTATLAWIAVELALLSAVAKILRAHTHHHGLAGVTFAVFATVSGVFVALFVARATQVVRGFGRLGERAALFVSAFAVFGLLVIAGVRTGDTGQGELRTSQVLVDGLALLVAAGIASSPAFARRHLFAVVVVPLTALILFGGLTVLRLDPSLRPLIANHAFLHAWFADLFAAR